MVAAFVCLRGGRGEKEKQQEEDSEERVYLYPAKARNQTRKAKMPTKYWLPAAKTGRDKPFVNVKTGVRKCNTICTLEDSTSATYAASPSFCAAATKNQSFRANTRQRASSLNNYLLRYPSTSSPWYTKSRAEVYKPRNTCQGSTMVIGHAARSRLLQVSARRPPVPSAARRRMPMALRKGCCTPMHPKSRSRQRQQQR